MESSWTPGSNPLFPALESEEFCTLCPSDDFDQFIRNFKSPISGYNETGTTLYRVDPFNAENVDPYISFHERTPAASTAPLATTISLKGLYNSSVASQTSSMPDYFSIPLRPDSIKAKVEITDHYGGGIEREDYSLFWAAVENHYKMVKGSTQKNAPTILPLPLLTPFLEAPSKQETWTKPEAEQIEPPKKRRRRKAISNEEKAIKQAAFLKRNRQSALKCRSRKKDMAEQLEEEVQIAKERNQELKKEFRGLLEEVHGLNQELANYSCDLKNVNEGKRGVNDLEGDDG